jgi:excisionase family DNA binding protein
MDKESSVLDYREPEWVAKKLGLDKNTVYKYLQEGWLPGVQLGRKWLISESLLAEHLKRETRTQTDIRRKALPQTPRLQRAIELAGAYAIRRGQDYCGTEHLLIGMMQEGTNVASLVIKNMGIDIDKPRQLFEAQVPALAKSAKQAPLTDRSRAALRLAQEQAIGLGHGYLGCEHLLLGLLLETSGMGNQILQSLGVTVERVRAEVLKLVQGRG